MFPNLGNKLARVRNPGIVLAPLLPAKMKGQTSNGNGDYVNHIVLLPLLHLLSALRGGAAQASTDSLRTTEFLAPGSRLFE